MNTNFRICSPSSSLPLTSKNYTILTINLLRSKTSLTKCNIKLVKEIVCYHLPRELTVWLFRWKISSCWACYYLFQNQLRASNQVVMPNCWRSFLQNVQLLDILPSFIKEVFVGINCKCSHSMTLYILWTNRTVITESGFILRSGAVNNWPV